MTRTREENALDLMHDDLEQRRTQGVDDDFDETAKSADEANDEFEELMCGGWSCCDHKATFDEWIEAINEALGSVGSEWKVEVNEQHDDLWRIVKKEDAT